MFVYFGLFNRFLLFKNFIPMNNACNKTKMRMFISLVLLFINNSSASKRTVQINVGTVLFKTENVNKEVWPNDDISLLEARRVLQHIISPLFDLNDEGIVSLFSYFQDAFAAVNQEAKDPETDEILTIALADVIGGYLRGYVLPTIRFAYYNGLVRYDVAAKAHIFYEDIKSYLKTDGKGWNTPNKKIIDTATKMINPIPLKRSITYTCEELVYEKSPKSRTLSLPCVHWDGVNSTMFLPFKKHSLYQLSEPETSQMLYVYYDQATTCLEDTREFNEWFQSWLLSIIEPHLNDEVMYPGLQSVLALVDKSKRFNRETKIPANPNCAKTSFSWLSFSKKSLMVMFVVCLEVVWCISAMIYMVLFKKRPCGVFCKGSQNSNTSLASDEETPFITNNLIKNDASYTQNIIRSDYTEESLSTEESSSEDIFESPLITKTAQQNIVTKLPSKRQITKEIVPKYSLPLIPSRHYTTVASKSERYMRRSPKINYLQRNTSNKRQFDVHSCLCCSSDVPRKPSSHVVNSYKAKDTSYTSNRLDTANVINEKYNTRDCTTDGYKSYIKDTVSPRRGSKIPKRCETKYRPLTSTPATPKLGNDHETKHRSHIPKLKSKFLERSAKTELLS